MFVDAFFTMPHNVPQIHAGRDLNDEAPTKICLSNLPISCQRSNQTRLAGILLLWAGFRSIETFFLSVNLNRCPSTKFKKTLSENASQNANCVKLKMNVLILFVCQ